MTIVSRAQGWDFKTRDPYVSIKAFGADTEVAFIEAVGLAYGAGLEVNEPFSKFEWKLEPDISYVCLTASADDGDCTRGGPLHRQRKYRIAGSMFHFVERSIPR